MFLRVMTLALMLAIFGCGKRSIIDTPIRATDFEDLKTKISSVCSNTNKNVCDYLKEAIIIQMPMNELPSSEKYINATNNIYLNFNGRTPREIIEIYKVLLLKDLDEMNAKNVRLERELARLHSDYEKTRHYASNIIISDIKYSFSNIDDPLITFTITNGLSYPINQLVAEVEFYSISDIYLGRGKAFIQPLRTALMPEQSAIITKTLQDIPSQDLELIKVARNLKIKISIPSVRIVKENNRNEIFVLTLPYSYHKMKELLTENKAVYTATVEQIKAITIE